MFKSSVSRFVYVDITYNLTKLDYPIEIVIVKLDLVLSVWTGLNF